MSARLFITCLMLLLCSGANASTVESENQHDSYYFDRVEWERLRGGLDYTEATTEEEPKEKAEETKKDSGFDSSLIFKIIYYSLIGGAFLGLLYWLIKSKLLLNQEKIAKSGQSVSDILPEIDPILYRDLLKTAIAEKDFRMAMRFYFLLTLGQLEKYGWVLREPDKTNREYVRELINTRYYSSFNELCLKFEVFWYGEHTIEADDFNVLGHKFEVFLTELKSHKR